MCRGGPGRGKVQQVRKCAKGHVKAACAGGVLCVAGPTQESLKLQVPIQEERLVWVRSALT